MIEIDPTFIPVDFYQDQLEDIQVRLEAVSRQNETPAEALGKPLGYGLVAERIGRVLMAVPGLPCGLPAITRCVYPTELRLLQEADIPRADKTKRYNDFNTRVRSRLLKTSVAVFLGAQDYRQQRGIYMGDARECAYYRAIRTADPVEIGRRTIQGMVIDWQEPVWLYDQAE